jgi:hypothetical protein
MQEEDAAPPASLSIMPASIPAEPAESPAALSTDNSTEAKRKKAAAIYAAWRNAHMNAIPVDAFNRLQAASPHLIDAIAAAL